MLAVIAAMAALGTALKSHADVTKAADDQYKGLLERVQALGPTANTAAKTMAEATKEIADLQKKLASEAPTQMASWGNAVTGGLKSTGSFIKQWATEAAQDLRYVFASSTNERDSGLVEMGPALQAALVAVNPAIAQTSQKISEFQTASSAAFRKIADDAAEGMTSPVIVGLWNMGSAFQSLSDDYLKQADDAVAKDAKQLEEWGLKAGYAQQRVQELGAAAAKSGMDWQEFANIVAKTDQIITSMVTSMVSQVTDSLAQMAINGAGSFSKLGGALLSTMGSAMKQIGEMWLAASMMTAMGIGPQSIGAAVALIALGSVVSAVGANMSNPAAGTASAISSGSSSSTADSGTTAAGTGAGGNAVSSAQQNVNNYITVSLPVEALDLSSVSDAQMRSLANRIARLISQGATGGQFSLAGA